MAEELVFRMGVSPSCRVIIAKISEYTKLTYILPVLMHVQEKRVATAESLAASLFPGLKPLCQALLDKCYDGGTLERDEGGYVLTNDGESALNEGMAIEEKRGTWKIYCLLHPLVPADRRVLRITDGSWDATFNPDSDGEYVGDLSGDISDMKDGIMTTVFGDLDRFRIDEIEAYEKVIKHDACVTMRLVVGTQGSSVFLDAPEWQDEGVLIQSPDLTYEDAWWQLLEQNRIHGWDADNDRLAVSYDGVNADERITMKKTLELEAELLGCRFEPYKRDICICPRSEYDAQRWAGDLFKDGINGYLMSEKCIEMEGKIKGMLPDFDIESIDRARYLDEYERGTPRFWYVQAAEDWGL